MNYICINIILFIKGVFLTNGVPDEWEIHFQTNGYITLLPLGALTDSTTQTLPHCHHDASVAGQTNSSKTYCNELQARKRLGASILSTVRPSLIYFTIDKVSKLLN